MKNHSTILKLIFMGVIISVLLIANTFIGLKLEDRENASSAVKHQIINAAGGNFKLSDCYLSIPYEYSYYEKNSDGEDVLKKYKKKEIVKPKTDVIKVNSYSEDRQIGIYSYPIFYGDITLDFTFDISTLKNDENYEYFYSDSEIFLGCADKSLQAKPVFTVNGKKYQVDFCNNENKVECLRAKVDCTGDKVVFKTDLKIRGAESLYFKLFSSETSLNVHSDWASPGFSDYDYLPIDYTITENGFDASWYVPFDIGDLTHSIGFDYIQSVNVYKKVERSIKYGFLFIIVPFIVLFLFEILAGVNLHSVNYLLSGAASVIFFLLLLSLSEHIVFSLAYLIAAISSGLLVSLYTCSVTQKIKFGGFMMMIFVFLYGYLFVCLKSEDYALLMGAIFAFVVLAVVMFITRKIDWSNLKKKSNTVLIEA